MTCPIVYLVTNKVNGKRYVGVTVRPLRTRWSEHLRAADKPVYWLHQAMAKYGKENFNIEQIGSCLRVEDAGLFEREVIQCLKPEYNQTNGGEHVMGRSMTPAGKQSVREKNIGRKRTAEARARMSYLKKKKIAEDPVYRAVLLSQLAVASKNIDHVKRIAATKVATTNRVWTDESRSKLSRSCVGRVYGKEITDRMARTKCKRVECIDLACTFDSVLEAAAATGVHYSNISKVCIGERKSAGGMKFQFA